LKAVLLQSEWNNLIRHNMTGRKNQA
jgi:hypothetical protein